MTTAAPETRRQLDFQTAEEVIAEIRRLQETGYQPLGNWSLTQICEHLDKTMTGGMEGTNARLPWILRKTVGKWFVQSVLKTHRMSRGIPTVKVLRPSQPSREEISAVIDQCVETLKRAERFSGPLPPHALCDNLSVEDWKKLNWVHAAHHLSFLKPAAEPTQ